MNGPAIGTPVSARAPSGWRRQVARGGVLLVITVILAELVARILFKPLTGRPFDVDELAHDRQARISDIQQRFQNRTDQEGLVTWHPYLGYAGRPGAHPWGPDQAPFNAFGMLSTDGAAFPSRKSKDVFVIGVLGGSVAEIFANTAAGYLQHALETTDPRFRNKQVVLVSLATGGYKEPQQLIHLEYALLSGFEFDAILNIDGFNDLALAVENVNHGINPLYPSGFHFSLMALAGGSALDPDSVAKLAQMWALFRQELRVLSVVQGPVLRQSALANLITMLWSARNKSWIERLQYELAATSQQAMDPVSKGPPLPPRDNALAAAAEAWRTSSEMIDAICRDRGIPYVHVLQPNQYVTGSKPLSKTEKKVAVNPPNPWGEIARQGYHYLVSEGQQLKARGEPFYDLTMLFQNVKEDIYTDNCCHFGPRGNEILAGAIAHAITQQQPGR